MELVAYGTDTDGYAFYVTYGPGPTFGLIFASKNKGIRSEAIFEAVLTALEEMGDPVIQDLVITGVFISIDGERDGLPEPTCGQSCQDNEVRPEGVCPQGYSDHCLQGGVRSKCHGIVGEGGKVRF